jgi:hypothetical protein
MNDDSHEVDHHRGQRVGVLVDTRQVEIYGATEAGGSIPVT